MTTNNTNRKALPCIVLKSDGELHIAYWNYSPVTCEEWMETFCLSDGHSESGFWWDEEEDQLSSDSEEAIEFVAKVQAYYESLPGHQVYLVLKDDIHECDGWWKGLQQSPIDDSNKPERASAVPPHLTPFETGSHLDDKGDTVRYALFRDGTAVSLHTVDGDHQGTIGVSFSSKFPIHASVSGSGHAVVLNRPYGFAVKRISGTGPEAVAFTGIWNEVLAEDEGVSAVSDDFVRALRKEGYTP